LTRLWQAEPYVFRGPDYLIVMVSVAVPLPPAFDAIMLTGLN
jgi:hypothetical protein